MTTAAEEALTDLADHIAESVAGAVIGYDIVRGELTLTAAAEHLLPLLSFLRDDRECGFKILVDICGADYPARPARFDVVYHLLSLSQNQRVRIKVATDEQTPVPSATGIYSSAGWYEREVWDMFGVYFDGNTDLRRILTDYGFDGHPLRKDFPLTGHVEVRYDEVQKRVVYEPVTLVQAYRSFDNLSPWEGMTDVMLPGDEKAVKPGHGWREASSK